ncbi:hypothetical protein CY34DRAFT_806182 [Suillus luteus UH-Slu-Lm8-n1]|uniref:Unplaced genomic scaffold CY34scaffold_140, whole genome shotgun sequence n=1 Tax=Suillus luteus UH-Slu-Lm8-n1 TaxID=930992 RepID=A0A0D0ATT6_9AGAM|nr:hypothetical protein CY34DRAFT_806182 [Suillus luteus UH-Slu-Lm8-n1]
MIVSHDYAQSQIVAIRWNKAQNIHLDSGPYQQERDTPQKAARPTSARQSDSIPMAVDTCSSLAREGLSIKMRL